MSITHQEGGAVQAPEGKKFYGSVTVSERGQIVIPADARKDFNIKTGDKLLVFADLEMGLWISTFQIIQKNLGSNAQLFTKPDPNKNHE